MNKTGFRVLEREQLRQLVPSVFATQPWDQMSERYKFIPTIDVVDALTNEGWLPVKAMQNRVRIAERKDFTKHEVRFRRTDIAPIVGDVFPEIVLINSHDGLSAYSMFAGLFRLTCLNGMVVGEGTFDKIRVRHSGNVVNEVVEGSYRIIDEVPLLADSVEHMRQVRLETEEKVILAQAALVMKYDVEPEEIAAIPVKAEQLLAPRRFVDRQEDNLWSTFNVVQEHLRKGGDRCYSPESRRRNGTREVKSITEDLRLNRALGKLAAETKKLNGRTQPITQTIEDFASTACPSVGKHQKGCD